jgi:hypothetical protein
MLVGRAPGGEGQEEYGLLMTAEGWLQVQHYAAVGLWRALLTAISDRYQSYKELIAEGSFAENGKLVDQLGTYHQYFEACIHMASLALKCLKMQTEEVETAPWAWPKYSDSDLMDR